MIRHLLCTLAAVLTVSVAANGAPKALKLHKIDSLEMLLPQCKTADDSVEIFFNILDLAVTDEAKSQATVRLFDAARNARDDVAQLDAIMYKANVKQRDTAYLNYLRELIARIEPSPRTREIDLFVEFYQIENKISKENNADVDTVLAPLLHRFLTSPPEDPYDRLRLLYTACARLHRQTNGNLMVKYCEELCKMVEDMNFPAGAVRFLIYSKSAPIFTENNNPQLASEIDKKSILIMDSLEQVYDKRGRNISTLNRDRYITYRRLLQNHKSITPAEISNYYEKIEALVAKDPDLKEMFEKNFAISTYYNMAIKDYPAAIQAILNGIDKEANRPYRKYFLDALLEAARATGREDLQLRAALELNEILQTQIESKAQERFREIQISGDVNRLREIQTRLDSEHHRAISQVKSVVIWVIVIGLVALLILLGVLLFQNSKMRAMARENAQNADRLLHERNELKSTENQLIEARDSAKNAERLKTDFINTMSHEMQTPLSAISEYSRLIVDCIPEDRRKYLDRFANIIDLNTRILNTLMNDVLDIASLESKTMRIVKEPIEISRICSVAMGNVFEEGRSVKEGIKVRFNTTEEPDRVVVTDGQRVTQVLVNLLSNAEKFTERGSIILDYHYDDENHTVNFTVTDTGQGIPAGKEAVIFERFLQLDHSVGGSGLGLYISSLIARLMGATLRVDTTYRRGARFEFVVPVG